MAKTGDITLTIIDRINRIKSAVSKYLWYTIHEIIENIVGVVYEQWI